MNPNGIETRFIQYLHMITVWRLSHSMSTQIYALWKKRLFSFTFICLIFWKDGVNSSSSWFGFQTFSVFSFGSVGWLIVSRRKSNHQSGSLGLFRRRWFSLWSGRSAISNDDRIHNEWMVSHLTIVGDESGLAQVTTRSWRTPVAATVTQIMHAHQFSTRPVIPSSCCLVLQFVKPLLPQSGLSPDQLRWIHPPSICFKSESPYMLRQHVYPLPIQWYSFICRTIGESKLIILSC